MKFSDVTAARIPNGSAQRIRHKGKVLWDNIVRYVSFGDSIPAGHAINSDWEKNYGTGSQYGVNGNTETVIVPGCYTELIRNKLATIYPAGHVTATSFARSGDTVADLIEKLDHTVVRQALAEADYVTVCIGANDILGVVPGHLEEYISIGDEALAALTADVNANIAKLADDSNANSYAALISKLKAINPAAQYVFTTVYNPYKYLWIDEGRDGFFGPLLDTIPDMSILGFDVDNVIKDGFLSTDIIQTLFDRINGLDELTETYVTSLNNVLRSKLAGQKNFALADGKTLYEVFPDRPVTAERHYNDLVNVEYTRSWDMGDIHWGRLWNDDDEPDSAAEFWLDLVADHVSTSGIDLEGIASDFLAVAVEEVISPDMDPHPKEYGQYVLSRSFLDAFGIQALDRYTVTYNANGGSGNAVVQTVVGVDGLAAFTNIQANTFGIPSVGYYFANWNTAAGGGGTAYSSGQLVGITGNLALYAQWSNLYTVVYRHSKDSDYHSNSDTGPMECYAFYIDGVEQADLSEFSNGAKTYRLPYGTKIKVVAETNSGDDRSYVTWNGTKVSGTSSSASYEFTLTSDVDIHFEWNYFLSSSLMPQSYWNCYITT